MIKSYLTKLGFEPKQSDIFLQCYQYGPLPASTIARLCKAERSYTYKVLESFVEEHLISQITIRKVKQYFVESPDVLLQRIHQQKEQVQHLEQQFHEAKSQLLMLNEQKIPYLPKVSQFAGSDGIEKRYEDMFIEIEEQRLIMIKYIVTDLFESQVTQLLELQKSYQKFLNKLQLQNTSIQGLLGDGSLVIESFQALNSKKDDLAEFAIGNQSMQVWIVGNCSYVGLFREVPIGIKIHSPDFANLWQVMIEHVGDQS